MDNKPLTFSSDGVHIRGRYYTVSNGFLSKEDGEVKLQFSELLSVEIVKHRSKKAMYLVLVLGFILISALSFVRNNLDIEDMMDAYVAMQDTGELTQSGHESGAGRLIRAVLMGSIVFVALVTITGVAYLFSGQRFIELTTMRGIYRVAVKREDNETINTAEKLRRRL